MRWFVVLALLAPAAGCDRAPVAERQPRNSIWESIYFESIDERSQKLDLTPLRDLHLEDNEIEIRIWGGFGLQAYPWGGHPLEGLLLRKSKDRFTGRHFPREPEVREVFPASGWHRFWEKIEESGIYDFPDCTELKGYKSILDGISYVVEVRRGSHYRNYHYGNPGPQGLRTAGEFVRLLELMGKETGFDVPRKSDKPYDPPVRRPSGRKALHRELSRRNDKVSLSVAPLIKEVAANNTPGNRTAARAAMASLDPRSWPLADLGAWALLEMYPDSAPELRRWLLALGRHGPGTIRAVMDGGADGLTSLGAWAELLKDEHDVLVEAAVVGIESAGAWAVRMGLDERLRELVADRPSLRPQLSLALARIGPKEIKAPDELARLARQGDEEESLDAIVRLGDWGRIGESHLAVLCKCLDHESLVHACAAAVALRRIAARTESVGDALARALDGETDPDRCRCLFQALGALGAPSEAAKSAVESALQSPDPYVRACASLAHYLASDDQKPLRAALGNDRIRPDLLALWVDWRLRAEPFADELLRLLESKSKSGESVFLIQLLQWCGPGAKKAAPLLKKLAAGGDTAPWTAEAARDAIRFLRERGS